MQYNGHMVDKKPTKNLLKFIYLSLAAAIATILLKSLAYFLTGSVGLLSDALESVVNLTAAIMAFFMLKLAATPPDEDHAYGHTKAEYFSSIVEGGMIFVAAGGILWTAVDRLLHPRFIEQPFLGLAVSLLAAAVNFFVGQLLIREGKKHRSITLEADGEHLMTDVWTSLGVFVAVILVALTNWQILDPLVAIAVAINILFSGFNLMRRSVLGFMDTAIPEAEKKIIRDILVDYKKHGVVFHALRTRQSGQKHFMSVHVLVPGSWPVQKGHDLVEEIEGKIKAKVPELSIDTHIEPIEDKRSWEDLTI